jgi:predicted ABC-type ATPase
MPEITITVSGPTGVGKSTVGELIAQALEEKGIAVDRGRLAIEEGPWQVAETLGLRSQALKNKGIGVRIVEFNTIKAAISSKNSK